MTPPRLADLLAALEDGAAALPFTAAVARQLARAPGPYDPGADGERRVAARVVSVLRLARRAPTPDGPERAGELLAEDPTLLAAFFQNVDLLYEHGYREADAVSLAVMHAVSLLEA